MFAFMYYREAFFELKNRILEQHSLIQVIVGPRQVGKTTMVKQLFELDQINGQYHIADSVSNADTTWIEAIWNAARIDSSLSNKVTVLAIDEIQKIHQWSEIVKRLSDEDKYRNVSDKLKIILLGSSKLLIQEGLSESLAGRFENIQLNHWKYSELKEAFGITPEQYAWFGAYPGSMSMIDNELRWKNYVKDALVETAITKDILMLKRIDKPLLLRRLFELGSIYSGQILSFNKILGQLQDAGNTVTLAQYLELMNAAGLLTGLQKFSIDAARTKSSSPKFQVQNQALMTTALNSNFEETYSNKKLWGRVIESAIGCHLMAYSSNEFKIYYWNESNAEVDFIIQYQQKYIALEVKIGTDKITGLAEFQKKFKPHKVYQLSENGLTWQKFITIDPKSLF